MKLILKKNQNHIFDSCSSTEEEIGFEDPNKHLMSFTINHDSLFLKIWENLILIIILYTLLITPLTISLHLFSYSFMYGVMCVFSYSCIYIAL